MDEQLKAEMINQVPHEVWSQHSNDVGLVKSADPIKIVLKVEAKIPRKNQYHLSEQAIEGIRETVEGLIKTRVLVTTYGPCNTPILPMQKADKKRWRLVHD